MSNNGFWVSKEKTFLFGHLRNLFDWLLDFLFYPKEVACKIIHKL